MKKVLVIIITFLIFIPSVSAKRGCCSHHKGVAGCSSSGRTICNDGTLSPTCTCTPTVTYTYGCTDKKAKNYNKNANKDNGSCQYYVYGCTDKKAKNYNPKAEKDDNSCQYYIKGCTDKEATNYNQEAEKDDGTCTYKTDTTSISAPTVNQRLEDSYNNTDEAEDNIIDSILTIIGTIGIGGFVLSKKIRK